MSTLVLPKYMTPKRRFIGTDGRARDVSRRFPNLGYITPRGYPRVRGGADSAGKGDEILVGWYATLSAAALTALTNGTGETMLTTDGTTRVLVPTGATFIRWAMAMGSDLDRAQIVTPSMQARRMNQDIVPIAGGAESASVNGLRIFFPPRPIALVPQEDLEVDVITAASTPADAFIELGQATRSPMPDGDIRRVHGKVTKTVTAHAWTVCTFTLDNGLEAGNYALVNFLPMSATCLAARAVDPNGGLRPGMPGIPLVQLEEADFYGGPYEKAGYYDMLHFRHNQVPNFEFFCNAADTVEELWMDVVKLPS